MNEAEKYLATREKLEVGIVSKGSVDCGGANNPTAGRNGERFRKINETRHWGTLAGLVLLSGLFAIVAAILKQFTIGLPTLLSAVAVAPPTEEILKVAIPIMVLEHRAKWIKQGRDLFLFALSSALVFAVVENLLYSFVYLKDPSSKILLWRWTACTAMHMVASGLSGVGLVRAYNRGLREEAPSRFIWEWPWLAGAIVVHIAYNAAAIYILPF